MQIATWNVNSIRTRLNHVTNWLTTHPDVDVLCLQETKVVDEQFPLAAFTDLGYYVYTYGQKSYNGVATIARAPLTEIHKGFSPVLGETVDADLEEQKRAIAVVANGIKIVNLYVPNGSAVGSDKYSYKLRWLSLLREYLQTLLADNGQPIVICGDFNVAREDMDIHDATNRETQVMATDVEREALEAILALGFKDAFRKFTTEPGHYSWWDYRAGSFRRNRGWRIDYHFITENLYDKALSCYIDVAPRQLEQPSDHAPVVVELQV